MSLRPCRECGQQVSTEAKTCPHCGVGSPTANSGPAPGVTVEPPKSSALQTGCLGCLGLVIVAIIFGSLSKNSGSGGSAGSGIIDLNARIQFDGTQFHITNLNSFAWTDCRLKVNDVYEFHADRIEAGRETTLGAMRFTKSDGERFDPLSKAAKKLSIRCHQPGGQAASYYATWKD